MTTLAAVASAARRDDAHELLLGRLRHDRVTVPRDENKLLEWAINVITVHATRKSVLEVRVRFIRLYDLKRKNISFPDGSLPNICISHRPGYFK